MVTLSPMDAPTGAKARRSTLAALVAAAFLGLALRMATVLFIAPLNSYLPDHLDMMAWSAYAFEHGAHNLYDFRRGSGVVARYRLSSGEVVTSPLPAHAYNYPPASAYGIWLQGALWTALDGEIVTRPVSARFRERIGADTVTSRVINTPAARFAQSLPSVALDFVLAAGVAALVGALRHASRWARPELAAFATTLLAPPILLDSAFWNQIDSWVSAGLVWTLWAALRERWWLAGALYGVALLTKPQAILLGPTLLVVAAALRWGEGGTWRRVALLGKSMAAVLLTVVVIAAPFTIADAKKPEGPLRWFERSYPETIARVQGGTTFNAFNAWWLQWMAAGASLAERDSAKAMLGTSRQTAGMALFASGIITALALVATRGRLRRETWVASAYLVCLAAFALPTGVHERYVYYCLPFLIALAALDRKRWLTPLVLLCVVGFFEMTSFGWVTLVDGAVEAGARTAGSLLALMTLAAFAYSLIAFATWPAPAAERSHPLRK